MVLHEGARDFEVGHKGEQILQYENVANFSFNLAVKRLDEELQSRHGDVQLEQRRKRKETVSSG